MKQKQELYRLASKELADRRRRAEEEGARRVEQISRQMPEFALCRHTLSSTWDQLSRIILQGGEKRGEAVAALRDQNRAAQERLRRLLTDHGYPADYLETPYTCPICQDTGFLENGKVCTCLKKVQSDLMLSELAKAHQLTGYGFGDFSLSYYSTQTDRETGVVPMDHMGQILDFCRHYAEGFSPRSDSLLFLGKTGLGKTHLSLAIAQEAAKSGYLVEYGTAQEHLRKLEREHFSREQSTDTLDSLLDCDLLMIDDLGSEFPSSFTTAMIYQLIDTRLAHGKPTIISTNLSWQELEERYAQRVVSRLSSSYINLRFVGQDIRQQKRFDG